MLALWANLIHESSRTQSRSPKEDRNGPVSRVLSRAAISLGRRLPAASSNRPPVRSSSVATYPGVSKRAGPTRDETDFSVPCFSLLGLAPSGVYRAKPVTRSAGALLPHRFTLTSWEGQVTKYKVKRKKFTLLPFSFFLDPPPIGGLLSVALSLSLRTVGVTHHSVLWSPDFPLPLADDEAGKMAATAQPVPVRSYSTPAATPRRDASIMHSPPGGQIFPRRHTAERVCSREIGSRGANFRELGHLGGSNELTRWRQVDTVKMEL